MRRRFRGAGLAQPMRAREGVDREARIDDARNGRERRDREVLPRQTPPEKQRSREVKLTKLFVKLPRRVSGDVEIELLDPTIGFT